MSRAAGCLSTGIFLKSSNIFFSPSVSCASPEVIKMAYKALVIKYHPDTYQGGKAFAEEKMKQLNEAYEQQRRFHMAALK